MLELNDAKFHAAAAREEGKIEGLVSQIFHSDADSARQSLVDEATMLAKMDPALFKQIQTDISNRAGFQGLPEMTLVNENGYVELQAHDSRNSLDVWSDHTGYVFTGQGIDQGNVPAGISFGLRPEMDTVKQPQEAPPYKPHLDQATHGASG